MTYREVTCRLAAVGIEQPALEARLLISHFAHLPVASILAEPGRQYEDVALQDGLLARCDHTPLAYILGEVGFFGLTFCVSPDCLIPRADTELLVEKAIALLPEGAVFTDLGTGSGCVALSVLHERPDCRAVLVDISDGALALAKQNADVLGLSDRATFCQADMRLPLPEGVGARYILSNPPYIDTGVIPTLSPEVAKEPRLALDGGEDGLAFYRAILTHNAPELFLFEIGYDQGARLLSLGEKKGYQTTLYRDLGGCDRVVVGKRR